MYAEAVIRGRTDNTIAKRERTKSKKTNNDQQHTAQKTRLSNKNLLKTQV